MLKHATSIRGAFLLEPVLHADERGFFYEFWNPSRLNGLGLDAEFVQDNYSRTRRNYLRGLHYQAGASVQIKLVSVLAGTVFDAIVDLRQESPTFGKWYGCILDAETKSQLWVPAGCAHGFLAISETADVFYKVSASHRPDAERTLMWNDPTIGIKWPLFQDAPPYVSEKDSAGVSFLACEKF